MAVALTAWGFVEKGLTPVAQRIAVPAMQASFELSERRACGLVGVDRSTCRYHERRSDWPALRERLRGPPSAAALAIVGSMFCSADRAIA